MRVSVLSDWLAQRIVRGGGAQPIYRQLHRLLQQAILTRELPAGARVPSSRLLAAELGIARNTVTQVYEQLALEGYVTSATGRGTFVADSAPDEIVGAPAEPQPRASVPAIDADSGPAARRALSARGARLVGGAGVSKRQGGAFMPGVPDVSRFPARVWTRLHNKYWRRLRPELLTYAPGGGLALLREALADYLRTSRSVRCAPGQIIVTTGIHQSIDLAVRLLTDPGDVIWTEDPCYWGVRSVMHVSGLTTRPISVDEEGIAPTAADFAAPPKLMLVTPSHQYPLGMVMSLARRRMLLEYARQHGAWIIEDDYDSEFRYGSRPLASLQGLDTAEQVIYVGSFSKTLFPGLRVGYLVVPEPLAERFATASAELYREGQLLQQAVLAEFIAEGHFVSHIRKMRTLYGQRRQTLLDALARRYGDALPAVGGDAGLHLVMRLPDGADDRAVACAALERDIVVRALSGYYSDARRASPGLLLGYACVPEDEIARAFDTLSHAIDDVVFGHAAPTAAAVRTRAAATAR
ncbi:PLP-dependent aminotransferase family protein [Burkholderia oklahomensis]|uniref:Aminotransferase class I and II family protein n=3 Tax=Burkholderia oklahomensis TaxID=342113 RepID=A0AAI8FQA1_9BURK|nr:PLP-dependent aminotransferase family protein [Burkholderia oklahomensis]AIO68974.1 aminotransferase class I and II family protein [Burkholderia oklahomensis]AOI40169.1 DNA-binding protein [Burkholderia oklahomensis EO147]KUY58719.1 DNA-binding protein [Burkholderia oklahomensis EO147]QPS39467.1 PLP-dependent aminotransferase family protein [Burkholderia oklahomensis]